MLLEGRMGVSVAEYIGVVAGRPRQIKSIEEKDQLIHPLLISHRLRDGLLGFKAPSDSTDVLLQLFLHLPLAAVFP